MAAKIYAVSISKPELDRHAFTHVGASPSGITSAFGDLSKHGINTAVLLSKIADVTYDLKIWEATGEYPERLVYDISGLHDPHYRPTFPLQPVTKYFWALRARYNLAGQSQAARWAFSNIPSNVPSEYPRRRPGGTCDLDAIPGTNYFRFITP